MEMEENQAQLCEASGDTAPDAGEQEDFEALIRGRYAIIEIADTVVPVL